MMQWLWNDILYRFGQEVTLRGNGEPLSIRAVIQPLISRGEEQEIHGPLGLERQERFRYLGPALYPLDPDTAVEWRGKEYRVQQAHLVGEGICPYWRAVLCPRDEEVQ